MARKKKAEAKPQPKPQPVTPVVEEPPETAETADVVRSFKQSEPVSFLAFMTQAQPVKTIDGNIVTVIRPDMNGPTGVSKIAPYGAYAKFVIDKNRNLMQVWVILPNKETPDFEIKNPFVFD
ncbi:MAG: hypothetical protein HC888_03035 [Candidatus Competibacteraceae bacterium]|nr:hypothetical protein [Candidatus Competibacteraceae bacterium]